MTIIWILMFWILMIAAGAVGIYFLQRKCLVAIKEVQDDLREIRQNKNHDEICAEHKKFVKEDQENE